MKHKRLKQFKPKNKTVQKQIKHTKLKHTKPKNVTI